MLLLIHLFASVFVVHRQYSHRHVFGNIELKKIIDTRKNNRKNLQAQWITTTTT